MLKLLLKAKYYKYGDTYLIYTDLHIYEHTLVPHEYNILTLPLKKTTKTTWYRDEIKNNTKQLNYQDFLIDLILTHTRWSNIYTKNQLKNENLVDLIIMSVLSDKTGKSIKQLIDKIDKEQIFDN